MREHYLASMICAIVSCCIFLLLLAACILSYRRTSKRTNSVLSKTESTIGIVGCITVCVLEIASIVSQQMIFTADFIFTPSAKGWGFVRSFAAQYMIPLTALSFGYLFLLFLMDASMRSIDASEHKHGVPRFVANRSITSKSLVLLGVLSFGVISSTMSFVPGVSVTLAHYIHPLNRNLNRAYLGMWNYWEATLLANALFVGCVSGVFLTIGLTPKDRKPQSAARLFNLFALVKVFEIFVYLRFASAMINVSQRYPINWINIRWYGPIVMFFAFVTCSGLYIVGTLCCLSAPMNKAMHGLGNATCHRAAVDTTETAETKEQSHVTTTSTTTPGATTATISTSPASPAFSLTMTPAVDSKFDMTDAMSSTGA